MSSLRVARFCYSRLASNIPRTIAIPAIAHRDDGRRASPQRIIKAPWSIFIGSESHAYAARLKKFGCFGCRSRHTGHIDSRVSGSGNANTNDLVSGNCEEIRIAVTTASHTPDGPCATGRPNDGAYDGADGERGGAADGWRRLEP